MTAGTAAPRRCCLAVPGSSARKLEKAAGLAIDEVVVDLEDAVVPAAKAQAREAAASALEAWTGGAVALRVNAPRTPWCHLDLAAAAAMPRVGSVVLPKVESAADVAFAERLLDGAEAAAGRAAPLRLQALVETAAGLAHVDEIAAASPRLDALVVGYADLTASLGVAADAAADPSTWRPVQHAVLVAARAHGLQAVDGPYLGLADDDGLRRAATHARDLGFDGKWAIHPAQVATVQVLFAPTDAEVARARAVVAALEKAERGTGQGAVSLDGELVDEAMRVRALRVLARAEQGGRAAP